MTICVNKPIRFVGDHDREVHVAGWLKAPDGSEAVAIFARDTATNNWWAQHKLFEKNTGKCLEPGCRDLAIENAPQISSGFFPLDGVGTTNARGLTTLVFARDDYPYAKHFVEIISEDGVPKEAKIHAR